MTYDPVAYWRERGETYEARFQPARYEAQEAALRRVLGELEFASVLEVGCGFGRSGAIVQDVNRNAEYTGIDLSPKMLASASKRIDGTFHTSALLDFDPKGSRWDLVLAVEVLMHVPPDDLGAAVRKLFTLANRTVVTVDWTTPLPRKKVAAHNFLHDYSALAKGPFGRVREVRQIKVGLQTIHVVSK